MYKIVASDLDGTLFTPNYQMTDFTKKIISLLIFKGIHFVFATGRHHIDVFKLKDILKIKSYLITSNGARIYDENEELIFKSVLDEDVSYDLSKIRSNDQDIITQIYCDDNWYINSYKFSNNVFCKSLFLKNKFFDYKNFSFNNVNKIFFTSLDINKLINLKNEILCIWGRRKKLNIFFSFPECLEIVPYKISKGKSLKLVSQLLGYSIQDCISFGDGMNDKEMLEMSGKGCIMKNADPELKKKLNFLEVIGTNSDDGVAQYLSNLFNL